MPSSFTNKGLGNYLTVTKSNFHLIPLNTGWENKKECKTKSCVGLVNNALKYGYKQDLVEIISLFEEWRTTPNEFDCFFTYHCTKVNNKLLSILKRFGEIADVVQFYHENFEFQLENIRNGRYEQFVMISELFDTEELLEKLGNDGWNLAKNHQDSRFLNYLEDLITVD